MTDNVCPPIDLYEFLMEAELQHYYNAAKNELKITNASQFKYATEEDLKCLGMSRPEIRRLKKFYEKHFPHGYLSKIKRLLQTPSVIVKRASSSNCNNGNNMGNGVDDIFINNASNTSNNVTTIGTSLNSLTTAQKTSPSSTKVSQNKHIIPADAISVNKQLGTGEFGIVQQGVWTNGTERIQVAIKCLCRERVQSSPMEFLKEAAIMHAIENENIVRLYGVVLAIDSLMLVTELAHLRSLLECLKDAGLRVNFLTVPTLCEFALQICNGMRYLESNRLIHRDLAARNILVFSKNKVKISDFGLSRALGVGKDYYKTNFNVNLKLPIAWCAPECINFLRFTNASDVWAYGVCLWEMFSYGFQPWAALTGLQILEAIDAPNYQRLEQPECCPREYYTLMMRCWQDDPTKRPKFCEIYELLPEMKPEQLKAVDNCLEAKSNEHLIYRQNDIITVLDRSTGTPYWKGVLNSGNTGLFNPSSTVAYIEGFPSLNRDSFNRNANDRCSKRKLRTEMISKPQNDFKHTGHVGIDGASFGDIAFLGSSQNFNHVPRQIVTPYKPSEDIEQTPLLLPSTPTSPDSLQTASGYFSNNANSRLHSKYNKGDGNNLHDDNSSMNPSFVPSNENTPKHFENVHNYTPNTFEFPIQSLTKNTNPFTAAKQSNENTDRRQKEHSLLWLQSQSSGGFEESHEYHEISDNDDNGKNKYDDEDDDTADKLDFGPSLMDEINSMFGSISVVNSSPNPSINNGICTVATVAQQQQRQSDCNVNAIQHKDSDFCDINSKLMRKNSTGIDCSGGGSNTGSSKKLLKHLTCDGTVKTISVKDEKILNHAIEIANEISARSMCNLVSDQSAPPLTQSPKRKFSFRFPHLTSLTSGAASSGGIGIDVNSSDKNQHINVNSNSNSNNSNSSTNGMNNSNTLSPQSKKKNFTEELKSIPDLQEIIGEEGREAYNSLIDRKSTFDDTIIPDPLMRIMNVAKTLPRRSTKKAKHISNKIKHSNSKEISVFSERGNDCILPPLQNAPRPTTLPTRGAAIRAARQAEMDLLMKSGTQLSLTNKSNNIVNDSKISVENASPCESPSYVTHTAIYKFPPDNNAEMDLNPLPVPSKEGKKHIQTNAKRHVRKYPLIIPANGVQRTINKIISNATKPVPAIIQNGDNASRITSTVRVITSESKYCKENNQNNNKCNSNSDKAASPIQDQLELESERTYQNVKTFEYNSDTVDDCASLQFESILEADFNKGHVLHTPDVTDGAFYNFSIQKEHYNKCKEFDYGQNKLSGFYVNEDELRNLDIESNLKKIKPSVTNNRQEIEETSVVYEHKVPEERKENRQGQINENYIKGDYMKMLTNEVQTSSNHAIQIERSFDKQKLSKKTDESNDNNELAGHALFQKVRESAEKASTKLLKPEITEKQLIENELFAIASRRLGTSNSVSCEDLLEFANKKPKGRERGVDSDEVRIMTKVLGQDVTSERCLTALDFVDWDVHKAIKIIKLQNILNPLKLTVGHCAESLEKYQWDLQTTSANFKSTKA